MKINILYNLCLAELEKHPEKENFAHWSFIIQEDKPLIKGINRKHEPPVYYGYHRPWDGTFKPKWHSELDAINKCTFHLKKFTCVNIRLNKLGQLRNSKPCKACLSHLLVNRCKVIYYSTSEGTFNKCIL